MAQFQFPPARDDEALYRDLNRGLALYATGHHFEAHEVWEYAWGGEVGRTKLALQALIQIAAALYKHQIGTPRGTSKLLAKAQATIGDVRAGCSAWLGIDFVALEREVVTSLAQADAVSRGEGTVVDPPRLPRASGPDGIIYLHGFASGPSSAKARQIVDPLAAEGFDVSVPDQNEGDFRGLTVSRALELARRSVRDRTLVIGSSLGGYLAALLAAQDERVKALVLMAPGFDLARRMETRYGAAAIEDWRRRGALEVDHYAQGGKQPIGFGFFEDALRHRGYPPLRVPTYLLHGTKDDTVPSEASEEMARRHPSLIELDLVDDGHALVASADRALAAAHRMIAGLALRKAPAPLDGEAVLATLEPS